MADIAKNTVKHGGRYYAPGELIEGLTPAGRKEALAVDAITVVADEKKGAKGGKADEEK